MIDLTEINKEIKILENSNNTSYAVCNKLAILYIIKDHYKPAGTQVKDSIPEPAKTVQPSKTL